MIKLQSLGFACVLFLMFSAAAEVYPGGSSDKSNASDNSGATPAEAMAAAQGALNRMDGGSPSASPASGAQQQPSSQNSAQQGAAVSSGSKPAWVDSPDAVYSRSTYVAAVGHAANRAMAENNAFGNLTAIFGQSIRVDMTITNTYQETVRSGVATGWVDDINMKNTIQRSADMDTLVGAEIRDVWYDNRSTYYAVAVMEKALASRLYTEMIKANQNMISSLVTMNQTVKNSLEGYSRYQFAAVVADINISYANLLRQIDTTPPAGLENGEVYRREARDITAAIPVGIRVSNDRAGRIQGAFADSLKNLGFRSGGTGSRYLLSVDVTVSPVDLPQNQNKFARIELDARLTDNGATIVPFNFNAREGHSTMAEAENRVYTAATRKISQDYANLLKDYLAKLIPERR